MEPLMNKYQLTLRLLKSAEKNPDSDRELQLIFENEDDVFDIIEKIEQTNLFNGKAEAIEFAIGFKMFGEVMLKHQKHPLFENFKQAFPLFVSNLKSISRIL